MKKCFKCGSLKPKEQFYKHPRMADGRLGKCKECAKADVASNIEIKKKDPQWVKSERARCRVKQERYRALGKEKINPEHGKKWDKNNKHKKTAHGKVYRAIKNGSLIKRDRCDSCGVAGVKIECHHDDYSKPLDVKHLCVKCHGLTRRKDFV